MASFKEKLASVLQTLKNPKHFVHQYKAQGREPFVLYFSAALGFFSVLVLLFSSLFLVQQIKELKPQRHPAQVVASDSQKKSVEHETGPSTEESGGVLQSPFPKEVLERADGISEKDHDLVDQVKSKLDQFKEGLKQKDLEIKKPHYFVLIDNITASAKEGNNSAGGIYANITLDLDSPSAEQEALAQITEFRSIITAIISEKQQASFYDYTVGIPDLKRDIQKRLQPMIKSGKIQDVLLEKFFFK